MLDLLNYAGLVVTDWPLYADNPYQSEGLCLGSIAGLMEHKIPTS